MSEQSDARTKRKKRLEVFHGDVLRTLYQQGDTLSRKERAQLAGKAAAYEDAIKVIENVDEESDGLWDAPMSSELIDDLLERSREKRRQHEESLEARTDE